MALMSMTFWRIRSSRVRCSMNTASCSSVFTGTYPMIGLSPVSQIASASAASFFCRLTVSD